MVKINCSFTKLRKRPFFAKNVTEKCQFQNLGRGQSHPLPPFRRPSLEIEAVLGRQLSCLFKLL